jgi:uncharacterized protein YndB with AHSA1/START domain
LERTVAASAEDVFRLLTSLEETPKWDPRVLKVTQMTRGALRTGVILRSTLQIDGESVHLDDEITDFEPPSRFGLRSVLGATNAVTYTLSEEDTDVTRISVNLAYELPDPPPNTKLDDNELRETIAHAVDHSLTLFQELVERRSAP